MISILGCGWLGLPLATKLNLNYKIKGSTTSLNKVNLLKSNDIDPFIIDILHINSGIEEFLNNEILIVNIPITQSNQLLESFYELKEYLLRSCIEKIIFISSTSVYEDIDNTVDETSLINRANMNLKIEDIFLGLPSKFEVVVLRMAGLIGPNRHPGKFFANKEGSIPNGLNPVNLVHLDDCLEVSVQIIKKNIWNETFNVCTPHHPSRKEFYRKATAQYCGKYPNFVEEKGQWKIINSQKLIKTLDYNFKYKDLFEAIKHC